MNECKTGEQHIWAGVGHAWECRSCGVAGIDCPDCGATGWAPPESGETGDVLCDTCKGAGVIPAKEAAE